MNAIPLHPDVQALVTASRDLAHFLERHGDDFWSVKIHHATDIMARSDAHGLRMLNGLFGGMGSLNDILFDKNDVNDEFQALKSKVSELACNLRHETC